MATVNKNFKTKNGIDAGGKITGQASTTSFATLNIPHGTAPSAPVNGDIWTTTTGLFFRMNGNTRTIADTTVGTLNGLVNINAGTGTVTTQIAYGATTSGNTKTINIGGNGLSGSTTTINIGSSVSGATTNIVLNGVATAQTATAGTNTTQIATTAFVQTAVGGAGGSDVFYQTTAPGSPAVGDIWVDSDETVTTLNSNDFLLKSGGTMTGNLVVNGTTTLGSASITTITGSTTVETLTVSTKLVAEETMTVAISDETTSLTTGTSKITFRAPFAMTLTQIPRASLSTASTSGLVTVDINENGVSVLGANKLSIDANEKTSTTAATATTLADTAIADDAEITVDIDGAGTGAKGLKITFYYKRT